MGHLLFVFEVTVANLHNEGIIGLDFLMQTQSVLDCRKLELQLPWETIQCKDHRGQPFCRRIIASETSSVPPGHEAILKGMVAGGRPQPIAGVGLLEAPTNQAETLSKGLLIARAVVEANAEVLPIRVYNPTKEERVVKQGTMVACLTQLQNAEQVEVIPRDVNGGDGMPSHVAELYERSIEDVPEQYHTQVAELLQDFADVFSHGPTDLGRTDLVQHSIDTGDARPV
ncbi:uncharacterized protein [Diadema antillarum]|uniref:uncharacterized protein n=1 Tax=Diadema antillarum TaxID=105358 RepID=UPI003A872273